MYAKRPNIRPNMQPENTPIFHENSKIASFRVTSPVEANTPDYLNESIEELVKNSMKPKDFKAMLIYLMKFWNKPDAKNLDGGLFNTYLTNEGKLLPEKEEDWSEEYKLAKKDPDAWALIDLEHNYVRAHSRQTYAYGIAFHMTGNPEYLNLCYKGAMALVNAMDGNYGMFTLQDAKTKKFVGKRIERDSQDLAYGLTGLGMYYFLTHDEGVLHRIIQLKDYIFNNYFDEGKGIFTWYPAKADIEGNKEIVAQLDQLYAYMLMLTPSLPEPYKSIWKKDLKKIADILIQQFYSQQYEFFWGEETDFQSLTLGREHTDFGHSVKTFWVIYKIGELLEDMTYINFARPHIDRILKTAYIPETGSWARRFNADGTIDQDKEWWILAELDQACEILALNDPSYLRYLNNTQYYWGKHMLDLNNGEVWHMVSAEDNMPKKQFPKVHKWKTSLHSFEYTLFGYMTSSTFHSEDFTVYYAFHDSEWIPFGTFAPYMFQANMKKINMIDPPYLKEDKTPLNMPDNNHIYKVTYNCLH